MSSPIRNGVWRTERPLSHDGPDIQPSQISDALRTPALGDLYQQVTVIADATLPVLVIGETGVGKAHVAELVHRLSRRSRNRLVRINCAAIAPDAFERELERFTSTSEGTILFDDVADLSLPLQAKLLGALEAIGSDDGSRPFTGRFVASTNRDIDAAVEAGTFRRDLYHRLAAVRLVVPALADRPQDIAPLAEFFVELTCETRGRAPLAIDAEAMAMLKRHSWPGNVRELRHVMELAALMASGDIIGPEHLQISARPALAAPAPLASDERLDRDSPSSRARVMEALAAAGGNQTIAAVKLGIGRRTLSRWLDHMVIPRPRKGTKGEEASTPTIG